MKTDINVKKTTSFKFELNGVDIIKFILESGGIDQLEDTNLEAISNIQASFKLEEETYYPGEIVRIDNNIPVTISFTLADGDIPPKIKKKLGVKDRVWIKKECNRIMQKNSIRDRIEAGEVIPHADFGGDF